METFNKQTILSNPMIIPFSFPFRTVIVADGEFPCHPVPLSFIRSAEHIICCDGATEALLDFGLEPDHIVGDIDSLSTAIQSRFNHCIHRYPDQETNDLTKAVNFCVEKQWNGITIVGATGKREDHTIGNISLIADYAACSKVQLITNYGVFTPMLESVCFESFVGQQVSIFSLTQDSVFTFHGLQYPLTNEKITSWWHASLNEALGNVFCIEMSHGKALVFREHAKFNHQS